MNFIKGNNIAVGTVLWVMTATRSPLSSRGYEQSEHPREANATGKTTLNGSPIR